MRRTGSFRPVNVDPDGAPCVGLDQRNLGSIPMGLVASTPPAPLPMAALHQATPLPSGSRAAYSAGSVTGAPCARSGCRRYHDRIDCPATGGHVGRVPPGSVRETQDSRRGRRADSPARPSLSSIVPLRRTPWAISYDHSGATRRNRMSRRWSLRRRVGTPEWVHSVPARCGPRLARRAS